MSKIKELQAKIRSDYEELIAPFLKLKPKEIINHAYELAHYNEIADLFENLDVDSDWFDDTVIDNLINYQGNILIRIYRSWMNYAHPENYNFFTFEGLIDIIRYEFRRIITYL